MVDTATVGGVMLGVCSIGRAGIDSDPISTMTSDTTLAKIGRWMKKRLSMEYPRARGPDQRSSGAAF